MIYSMYCTWLNMVKLHCSTLIWAVLAGLSAVFLAVIAGVEVPEQLYQSMFSVLFLWSTLIRSL